jgi:hypothetical protein
MKLDLIVSAYTTVRHTPSSTCISMGARAWKMATPVNATTIDIRKGVRRFTRRDRSRYSEYGERDSAIPSVHIPSGSWQTVSVKDNRRAHSRISVTCFESFGSFQANLV